MIYLEKHQAALKSPKWLEGHVLQALGNLHIWIYESPFICQNSTILQLTPHHQRHGDDFCRFAQINSLVSTVEILIFH